MAKITSHRNQTTSLNLDCWKVIDLDNALRFVDFSTMRATMDAAEYEQATAVIREIHDAISAHYLR